MKNKKGFTLIEIIVCIGLIVLIGTSSIVGFKVISNKKLINKLDSITERASEAAQVYIETNDTAYNQLYDNKNGVSLPLRVLVNEGLLSLEGTDLTEKDIENQYVVTFLGGTGSSENCEQITSTTSWGNDKAIYLCMNSNGSSNLAIIDPTKYSNKTNVSSEPYYFVGGDPQNYVKYNDQIYRIISIEKDDSLILYSNSSFGNTFDGKTQSISYIDATYKGDLTIVCNNGKLSKLSSNIKSGDGQQKVDYLDVMRTFECGIEQNVNAYDSDHNSIQRIVGVSWLGVIDGNMKVEKSYNHNMTYFTYNASAGNNAYKIHLNSNFKLGSGTGDYSNPYILEYK